MIHQINNSFNHSDLVLKKPVLINGSYIIKFGVNEKPFYVQFPQCKLKSGIQKSGKKFHCDLMFTNQNENLIEWMENLESYCKKTILTNRAWFDTDLEEDDIDTFFTSTFKSFKSGKYYNIHVHVPVDLGIYDECGENKIAFEQVHENASIITIIELIGIKCSDKNFQIETEVKQMLVMKEVREIFDTCLIKLPGGTPLKEQLPMVDESPKVEPSPIEEEKEEKEEEKDKEEEKKEEKEKEKEEKEEEVSFVVPEEKITEELIKENIESIDLEQLIVEDHPIKIKTRNDIYEKMYKDAKEKAKVAKKTALIAYLEAKRIKNEYMIDDMNDSENEENF
jgi:hypothetical protein